MEMSCELIDPIAHLNNSWIDIFNFRSVDSLGFWLPWPEIFISSPPKKHGVWDLETYVPLAELDHSKIHGLATLPKKDRSNSKFHAGYPKNKLFLNVTTICTHTMTMAFILRKPRYLPPIIAPSLPSWHKASQFRREGPPRRSVSKAAMRALSKKRGSTKP